MRDRLQDDIVAVAEGRTQRFGSPAVVHALDRLKRKVGGVGAKSLRLAGVSEDRARAFERVERIGADESGDVSHGERPRE